MTAVFYFSGAGHSRVVAEYLAGRLGWDCVSIENAAGAPCSAAAVVFPVYSDNIPAPVKSFLQDFQCDQIALIAVHGRMSHGNVLTQAAKLCRGEVICGAYIPTGHTYLAQPADFNKEALAPIIGRLLNPKPAIFPRERQSFLGRLFPETRARMMVSISVGAHCSRCGICRAVCPMGSMMHGRPGKDCLRCMRCVDACPAKALTGRYSPILKGYLRHPRITEAEIYL